MYRGSIYIIFNMHSNRTWLACLVSKINTGVAHEISAWMFWNILTLVIAPVIWAFRGLVQEVKRIDILLNKTREEYAINGELKDSTQAVMDALHRVEDKLIDFLDVKMCHGKFSTTYTNR